MNAILRIYFILFFILSSFLAQNCLAAPDLMDVFEQALCHDPLYLKAWATRLSQGEQLPQQVAALLPQISAVGNVSWNRNVTLRAEPPAAVPLGTTTFPAKSYLVTVSQSLLNLNEWFLTSEATAVDKEANATFMAAYQDLIVRVVRAYLQVLNDQETLHFLELEQEAYAQQLTLAKKRFKLGVDIITGIYNAEASYDSSTSRVITAKKNLQDSLTALTLLTGINYVEIEKLKRSPPLLTPCPAVLEAWIETASKYNWSLVSARYAVIAAQEAVKAIASNHAPTVSLTGTYGPSYGQSTGLVDTVNNVVAVQMNLPIFEGGLVLSQTRQAKDQLCVAYHEMQNQYLQAITTTKQRYTDVVFGVSQVRADRKAVTSNSQSVVSTKKAYKVGTRSIFDVLIAQRDLLEAQRTAADDEYLYLINTILLKQASGNLSCSDVVYINQFLHLA